MDTAPVPPTFVPPPPRRRGGCGASLGRGAAEALLTQPVATPQYLLR